MTRPTGALLAMAWLCACAAPEAQAPQPPPPMPLQVSENGRHLVDAGGRPFFWLGDTAWLLFQKTSRDDAEHYLATRARQGFTVVQAAAVMGEERVAGVLVANTYGDQAFIAGNPARPAVTPGSDPRNSNSYDYWDHVDFIVDRAAAHGLRLGLLPLFVGFDGHGYRYLTPETAFAYGQFLGRRYGARAHVFWVLGGDSTPDTPVRRTVWSDVARGISIGATGGEDYTRTLMTYHINGQGSSSQWVHDAPWLDFNMVQIWGAETFIYPNVARDYARVPVKPTGLAEGSYEDGPQYGTRPIDAQRIRQQAYWSYFAGGYHTYGNTNVWNFGSFRPEATQDWRDALESRGAEHLSVLAGTMTALRWWELEPAPQLASSGMNGGVPDAVAMRSADGARVLVYAARPGRFIVRLDALPVVRATWIDPQTGTWSAARLPGGGAVAVDTPAGWSDALLLIEAAARTQ